MARDKFKKYFLAVNAISFFLLLTLAGLASADVAGEQRYFYVDLAYDSANREQVQATLRRVSERAYFYFEDDWWNNLSADQQIEASDSLTNLSNEFDQKIYPQMTLTYGSEWNPGIDNDSRITILVTKIIDGAGGYFSYINEYPKNQFPKSNEREMVFLNALFFNDSRISSFLAHEFQHLITFSYKNHLYGLDEDIWLNEARSEYAETLLGYDKPFAGSNLERRVSLFLSNPTDSLTEWRNEKNDYGVVNLFMQYLVEHYGTEILGLMTQNRKVGIASVEEALQALGKTATFNDVFANWALANYLNDCSLYATKYCYLNPNLSYDTFHISPTATYSIGYGGALELASWVKDWSPRWYKIVSGDNQPKMLQVNFEGYGLASSYKIAYILEDQSGGKKIYFMNVDSAQKSTLLVPDFGVQTNSIVLIPFNAFRRNGFSNSDPNMPFSFKLSTSANQPSLYPTGTLVKSSNDSKVYYINGGIKQWISSAEIFLARGFKWQDIILVQPENLSLYSDGQSLGWPDGYLIKSEDYPTVYIISSGKKRSFASAQIFQDLGYQWENIKIISQQEIGQYELGSPVSTLSYPDSTLVRFSDSPNIYLIEGGRKRLIPSINVFIDKGYNFELVVIASPAMRSMYPDGGSIQ